MSLRVGRHGPRSKVGCTTCRTRKVKCDERRPLCSRCERARLGCEWDKPAKPRRSRALHHDDPGNQSSSISGPASLPPLAPWPDNGVDMSSKVPMDPRQQLPVLYQVRPDLLRPALSTTHIPLSNSLTLSLEDRKCFQYIPSSLLVQALGKPWPWSTMSYLHSRIAMHEKGVMRAFIALASMEMRCRHISADSDNLEAARRKTTLTASHYRLALGDLSRLLDRAARPDRTDSDLDMLFAVWFLIVWTGTYDAELVQASHVHLRGIQSFISQYIAVTGKTMCLPRVAQQLLYFISVVDTKLALGNLRSGQLAQGLLSLDPHCQMHHDRLFQEGRKCLSSIWGAEYPAEQLLDDLENYRPLSLLQACEKLQVDLCALGITLASPVTDPSEVDRLWQKIQIVGEVFADVITMAHIAPNSGGRRVMWTIYHGALEYNAIRVLFSCLSHKDSFPSWLDTTMTDLLSIAYKALSEDPLKAYRYAWSLTVAMLRARDPIRKEWISSQVRKAHRLVANPGIPAHLLEQNTSATPDAARLLDSPAYKAFDSTIT